MNTGEVKEIGLLDMMSGAVSERVSYELAKIMRNCKDLNTEPKKARTLTIEFSITPTETRDSAGTAQFRRRRAGRTQADQIGRRQAGIRRTKA